MRLLDWWRLSPCCSYPQQRKQDCSAVVPMQCVALRAAQLRVARQRVILAARHRAILVARLHVTRAVRHRVIRVARPHAVRAQRHHVIHAAHAIHVVHAVNSYKQIIAL